MDAGGDLPGPLLGHRDAPRQQAEQGDGQVGYIRIYQDISESEYLNIFPKICVLKFSS